MDKKRANILLVEDSETDALMTIEAMRQSRVLNTITTITDGEAAMKYLLKEEPYADAPTPDMILLDLNLPKKDGRQVLSEIKADPELRLIPVVILTTSKAESDICNAYGLNANCYIVKPVNFERFAEALRLLETFWFEVVALPPKKR